MDGPFRGFSPAGGGSVPTLTPSLAISHPPTRTETWSRGEREGGQVCDCIVALALHSGPIPAWLIAVSASSVQDVSPGC